MYENVVATFDDVKFIEGETLMTQANWQEFFGTAIPNGIYSGLEAMFRNRSVAVNAISDGVVYVNGLFAKIETENGYTTVPASFGFSDYDRFICIRVYLQTGKAQIVEKYQTTTVPQQADYDIQLYSQNIMKQTGAFINDESYCCTRNDTYWDIPIYYQGYTGSFYELGTNLRRPIKIGNPEREVDPKSPVEKSSWVSGIMPPKVIIASNSAYNLSNSSEDLNIWLDPVNVPDGATIQISRSDSHEIYIHRFPGVGDVFKTIGNVPEGHVFGTFTNWITLDGNWSYDGTWGGTYRYTGNETSLILKFQYITKFYDPTQTVYCSKNFSVDNLKPSEYLSVQWDSVLNKPTKFPPQDHTHDDRYYTEEEIDTMISSIPSVDNVYTKTQTDNLLSAKANAASPVFTGNPTAPTQPDYDNSTKLATTQFVKTAMNSYVPQGLAPIDSPVFTGIPQAPTQGITSNSNLLATTKFVQEVVAPIKSSKAPIDSPAFSGTPQAPTPPDGNRSNRIATTGWVSRTLDNFNPDLSSFAPINSPTFTGTVQAPTPASGANDARVATTEFVKTAITNSDFAPKESPLFTGTPIAPTPVSTARDGRIATAEFVKTALANYQPDLSSRAPIYSPIFGGEPQAPTPPYSSNNNRLATTEFVKTAISSSIPDISPLAPKNSPIFTGTPLTTKIVSGAPSSQIAPKEYVDDIASSIRSSYAPTVSPTFTGTPKAPTAAAGNSSTQIATTAFVTNALSNFSPSISGYAPLASPTFTGTPKAPTASASTNSTQIATTAFVQSHIQDLTKVSGRLPVVNGGTVDPSTPYKLYVSTSGNDSTGTGASTSRYKTIQKAVDMAPWGAYTEIYIAAGSYSGSSANPNIKISGKSIRFIAEASSVSISNSETKNNPYGIEVCNGGTLVLDGDFNIQGSSYDRRYYKSIAIYVHDGSRCTLSSKNGSTLTLGGVVGILVEGGSHFASHPAYQPVSSYSSPNNIVVLDDVNTFIGISSRFGSIASISNIQGTLPREFVFEAKGGIITYGVNSLSLPNNIPSYEVQLQSTSLGGRVYTGEQEE